jgi:ATP-binding cassette, subfamily B, bacterial
VSSRNRAGQPGTWARVRASLFWRMLARQRPWVVGAFVLFVMNALATLQVTRVTVNMVDQAIDQQTKPLGPFIWQIIGLAVIGFVVGFFQRIVTQRLSYQLEFDVRTRLYAAVHNAPPERLHSMVSGQLITRSLTDLHLMERFLAFAPTIVGILPLFVGVSIYMVVINPVLALVAMGGLPINVWLLRRFRTRLWGLSFAELNERAQVASAIDEPVRGIRVVRAFGREEYERERVADTALRTFRFAMTRWRLLAKFDVPLKLAPVLLQGLLLFLGARLVRSGSLTLGTFMLAFQVNAYVVLVAGLVDEVASLWQYLRSAQHRIGEVLDMGSATEHHGGVLPEPKVGLRLDGVGVTFGGREVLGGMDLHAAPGELVVVTGAPSSGKSTLAAVASGALAPHAGAVSLEGVDLADVDPISLRASIRVVSEEPHLFATTVRENLELGVPDQAPEEAIWKALRVAAAADFVEEMKGALEATVGDRGLTLSGGQRQRLGLARALVSPPRVLVLDDALTAVNPALEVDILQRVRAAYPGVAIVCLSRRAASSTVADRIIALPDPVYTEADEPLIATASAHHGTASEVSGVIDSLQLSTELPGPTEADVAIDSPLRPSEILRPFRLVAAAGLLVLALQSLVRFAPEVFIGEISDAVREPDSAGTDVRAFLLVLIGVFGAATAYLFRILSQRFAQGALYLLRRRVFQRLSRLGIDFYDREMPGQVAARVVHDLDMMQSFVQSATFQFFTTLATAMIGLVLVLVISPGVFPVVLGLVVFLVAFTIVQYPFSTRAFARAREHLGIVTSTFEEDYNARDAIRGYGAVPRQTRRFVERSLELRKARRWVAGVNALFSDLMQFASLTASALVLYRSGDLVLAGSISVGSAITLRLVAQTATQPLSSLSRFYTELLEVRVSWRRLQEPFRVPILPVDRAGAIDCPPLAGEITFDAVAFSYPHTKRPVLHEISFTIPAGTVASMVGYTGAGKSTIAKLLLRTYDPDAGAVRIDGRDLREVSVQSFRRRIAVVPQDAFVFRGTVATNIAYGRLRATREEIEAAAEAVSAAAVLRALPDGYDHPVEEEGRNLTAAQRQLIALARAWIAGPDVLVLDEATSCLDARLEQQVLEAVSELGCTTLMVTHRDNVVAASDLVIVLEAGRVVQSGTPDELRGAGGAYDRLWVQEPMAAPDGDQGHTEEGVVAVFVEPDPAIVGSLTLSTSGAIPRRARRRSSRSSPD